MNALAWLAATRPRTLVASLTPVAVGTVLAWRQTGQVSWKIVFLCLGFAAFMQIGANFSNDYFDFRKGADREDRIGPARAVASGAIKPRTMLVCSVLVLAIGFKLCFLCPSPVGKFCTTKPRSVRCVQMNSSAVLDKYLTPIFKL